MSMRPKKKKHGRSSGPAPVKFSSPFRRLPQKMAVSTFELTTPILLSGELNQTVLDGAMQVDPLY